MGNELSTGIMDLSDCDISIDGLPVGGFIGDSAVEIEWDGPIYNTDTGPGGDHHRATSNNRGGKFKFNISQTAIKFRGILDGICRKHEAGLGGSHTIQVRSRKTGETYVGYQSYPTDRPNAAFGNSAHTLTYTFATPNLVR